MGHCVITRCIKGNAMTTKIQIIMRSTDTQTHEYHADVVNEIPSGGVCVVFLGGNGTVDQMYPKHKSAEEIANGDAKRIRNEIIKPFFNDTMGLDIPVYAVAYDFDDYGGHWEIYHDIHRNALEINRKNMRYLFHKYILTKISQNGTKISVDEVKHRWPAYLKVFCAMPDDEFKFGCLLHDTLLELKYTDAEIQQIETLVHDRYGYTDNDHITDLFNRIIMPRLAHNGKRRSLNDALIEIRKITFVSHCYGALLIRKLQDYMRAKMPELGYMPDEIKTILSQMLVIAHAPSGRLDKQTEAFFSFASAFDDKMWVPINEITSFIGAHRKSDEKYMRQNSLQDIEHTWIPKSDTNMRAMFLPRNMGNMFIIPRGFDADPNNEYEFINEGEHDNTHYIRMARQNKYGLMLNSIERNILISGIKNSLAQGDTFVPLPELGNLVQNPYYADEQNTRILYMLEQMQKNGQTFLRNVFENAMAKLRNKHQKSGKNITTTRGIS